MNTGFSLDFIGVGGEKTASTWIYKCLLEHPQICGPREKELSYFDTVKLIGVPEREKSEYEKRGLEGYREYFKGCPSDAVIGEFTVTYLHDKKVAPLLAELFPDIKIIISLRNPIERTFSQYLGLRENQRALFKSFEVAIEKEPEFIRRSMYSEYISEYLKYFPKDRIFITLQDDIIANPLAVLQQLFRFLGVDDTFVPPSTYTKERSAEDKGVQTIRDRIYGRTITKLLARAVKKIGLSSLSKRVIKSFVKKPTMSTNTRSHLFEIFKKDIGETSSIIGRDLSSWK